MGVSRIPTVYLRTKMEDTQCQDLLAKPPGNHFEILQNNRLGGNALPYRDFAGHRKMI